MDQTSKLKSKASEIIDVIPDIIAEVDSHKINTKVEPLFKNESGKTIGVLSTARDITEQKTNEEDVKRMNKLMIGRELKMKELKNQVSKLEQELQSKPNPD